MTGSAPYGRTVGTILALLIVALFTKFSNLLLTPELTFRPPGWSANAGALRPDVAEAFRARLTR